jgi:hypothetical protein
MKQIGHPNWPSERHCASQIEQTITEASIKKEKQAFMQLTKHRTWRNTSKFVLGILQVKFDKQSMKMNLRLL